MTNPTISIVIPTTCEETRTATLSRAIDSLLSQQGVDLELIVVVNGQRYQQIAFDRLRADSRIRTVYLQEGNVSRARHYGITMSGGAFFGFLDDDDELLPDSLALRAAELLRDPSLDVVVTNGYLHNRYDVPLVPMDFGIRVRTDPAQSFLEQNWFASPAPLFRRASVSPSYFDIRHRYYELTYLFFSLYAARLNFTFLDQFTYRVHQGDIDSASSSRAYALALPDFLLELLKLPLPEHIKSQILRKRLVALNSNANLHATDGDLRSAFLSHWQCLRAGGWRYLPFTLRLVEAALRRRSTGHR